MAGNNKINFIMRFKYFYLILTFLCGHSSAFSQCWPTNRPDGHAPIGVMADHLHPEGSMMIGYHFEYMQMNHPIDPMFHVHSTSGNIPHHMDMQMHMVELMYGVTGKITFMVTMPFYTMLMKVPVQNSH